MDEKELIETIKAMFYSGGQAAEVLNITSALLQYYANTGAIRRYQIGHLHLYSQADVARISKMQQEKQAAQATSQ